MELLLIDPVFFTLGPLSVHWYGLFMALSVILGLWLARCEARRLGLNGDIFIDLVFWVLPAAIIGARIYYVFFNWDNYSTNPVDALALWKGGLAIHGGLIGAFIAGYFFVRKHNLSFLQLADIAAPSIILGQAMGRWGNFVNQEAYGGPVSRGFLESLHLPHWLIEQMNILGTYYHPTFLYESLWNLAGFGILFSLRYLDPRRGVIFFSYLIWYSIGRFFIEGLRTDSLTFHGPVWLEGVLSILWAPMRLLSEPGTMEGGNIRVAQLMSLLIILTAAVFIVVRQRKTGTVRYMDVSAEPKEVSGQEG
jgi:phosphatidylglycerol:prolipoprotein diacylglycerol transferase